MSAEYLPELREAVAELEPGDRLLMQVGWTGGVRGPQKPGSPDPLAELAAPHMGMAPLQEWVLQRIGQRFDLQVIHRDSQQFVVAELVARQG